MIPSLVEGGQEAEHEGEWDSPGQLSSDLGGSSGSPVKQEGAVLTSCAPSDVVATPPPPAPGEPSKLPHSPDLLVKCSAEHSTSTPISRFRVGEFVLVPELALGVPKNRNLHPVEQWFIVGRVVGLDSGQVVVEDCLLYTSPSPRDYAASRMPSSA